MAGILQFDLVSPERRLASFEATEVQIPGSEGDMTAMADHAPTITTLRPGILKVVGPKGDQNFAVTGGFAEIAVGSTTVLAEQAMPVAELTADVMASLIADATSAVEAASAENKDAALKNVADLEALRIAAGV